MNNEYLSKLLNKIDLNLVKRFERAQLASLHFVPVVIQNDIFYAAIPQDANKTSITDYAKDVLQSDKIEFIILTDSNFNSVFPSIMEKVFENNDNNIEVVEEDDNQKNEYRAEKQFKVGDISQVKSPQTKKIGQILVEERLLTEEQVNDALIQSKSMGLPLGSTLVKLGFITIKQLRDALAAQMQIDVASEEQLSSLPDSMACLSDDFVMEHKVIPLSFNSKSLTVGMVNPKDTDTINQIIGMTGLKPAILMVTSLEFERYMEQYHKKHGIQPDKGQNASKQVKSKSALEALTEEISASQDAQANQPQTLWQRVQSDIDDISSDAARYANLIVTQAIDLRASDIHLEPRLDGYVTRYRIDGTLIEVVKIPSNLENQIVSRFKVLAKMNIAEHRRPQDGNFTIKYKQLSYDFRINSLPVNGREKLVIRILAPSMTADESYSEYMDIPGAFPDDLEKLKFLTSVPNGIVLTSGPTGSGKTTTLYSILKTLNSPETNITTIEDPIEIRLEGVNQSAVNPKAGITFASCMRAILRQDPDIILVGEIRDLETLEVAISASLTGHLVLSTIHTNSAAATVTRLIEMGAKDYLISSTLNGVLAQRLVKKLCPDCKEAYNPTEEELLQITRDPERIKQLKELKFYRAKGCPNCDGTGYKGRLALLEILVVNKDIKKLIATHSHDIEIEEHAVANGMRTLKESCIKHILEGNTTIKEFVRVLGLVGE